MRYLLLLLPLLVLGCATEETVPYAAEDLILHTWTAGVTQEDFSRHPATGSPYDPFWRKCELTGNDGFNSKTSYFCK